jgi:2',3'-cyclic-nucleotide 2'-phosphodiesterase (5'-nucleotidase family)
MASGQLTIAQLNDSHAYLEPHLEVFWEGRGRVYRTAGGYARIGTILQGLRAENPGGVLFCDGGDTLHGTYPAQQTKGQAVIPALNALGPDAMTAHWEFAYTPQGVQADADRLEFPMLAANVHDPAGRRPFPATRVVERAGLRIGLVGLAAEIVDDVMPPEYSGGLTFTHGRAELPRIIDQLREEDRADLVVLISHLGFPQDMKLLEEVEGVDVCLSAHTHHRMRQPARQGKTVVIQSGSHGSFVGILRLAVEGGQIVSVAHELRVVADGLAEDPAVAERVEAAVSPYREKLNQMVGRTETALDRATQLEASADYLILQAIREHTGAELAFSNGWRYGAPIAPGPIRLNDLYNLTPMNPPISTVDLSGAELTEMIEDNLEHTFSRDPFRQKGGYVKRGLGLRVYFKVENPYGQRVQRLFVGEDEVQPERRYRAVFITVQGVPPKYQTNRQVSDDRVVTVMQDYLRRHDPLRVELAHTFVMI